jgi:hypothetical protein
MRRFPANPAESESGVPGISRNELAIGMNSKQKNRMRRDCLIWPGWPQKKFTGVERESGLMLPPASASRKESESHERKIG